MLGDHGANAPWEKRRISNAKRVMTYVSMKTKSCRQHALLLLTVKFML